MDIRFRVHSFKVNNCCIWKGICHLTPLASRVGKPQNPSSMLGPVIQFLPLSTAFLCVTELQTNKYPFPYQVCQHTGYWTYPFPQSSCHLYCKNTFMPYLVNWKRWVHLFWFMLDFHHAALISHKNLHPTNNLFFTSSIWLQALESISDKVRNWLIP